MRNAFLPSHLHNFGNNDFQMPNWYSQVNMNRTIGFCTGSKAIESDNHNRASGDFSLPLLDDQPSLLTYQPVYSNEAFIYDQGISQQPMLLDKKIDPVSQFEEDYQAIQNARKRPITEVNDILPKNGYRSLVGDRTASNEWNKNKRSKATDSQQQWQNQFEEASMEVQNNKKFQAPVRRSQKLSDKITVLQKLVSPYGKTDTASVLQEASIYITLLQQQIQNLFRMLGSSYKNAAGLHLQDSGSGQMLDLRSKGLCLVPISITQRLTMEEVVDDDHLSSSRKFVIASNF